MAQEGDHQKLEHRVTESGMTRGARKRCPRTWP